MQQTQNPSTSPSGSQAKTIQVVYDGECPVCSYLFADVLRLRSTGWHLVLTNARDFPDEARMLMMDYGVDINREFGSCIDGDWRFGGEALYAIFLVDRFQSAWINRGLLRLLRFVYPVMRSGRNVLLWTLGREPIKY